MIFFRIQKSYETPVNIIPQFTVQKFVLWSEKKNVLINFTSTFKQFGE